MPGYNFHSARRKTVGGFDKFAWVLMRGKTRRRRNRLCQGKGKGKGKGKGVRYSYKKAPEAIIGNIYCI